MFQALSLFLTLHQPTLGMYQSSACLEFLRLQKKMQLIFGEPWLA